MTWSSQSLNFDNLRPWQDSRDGAFEELSYQLLKDETPPGTTAVRTGNPDGGVEWFANLPNGDQWGWQAKNVHGIDALLTAMTESVQQIVAERPNLVRLMFVVSWNLATGTSKGQRKSQRQKYEDRVETWKQTIAGAERIEFELKQESDMIDLLALPRHRGRTWFWWARPTLGSDWLQKFHDQQASVAGDKYRPELQVDLPIGEDLQGLGLSQLLMDEFAALRKRLAGAIQHLGEFDSLDSELEAACQEMCEAAAEVAVDLGNDDPFLQAMERFDALERSLNSCLTATRSVRLIGFRYRDSLESARGSEGKGDGIARDRINHLLYECQSVHDSGSAMQEWLRKSSTRAARSRLYFLVGPAGSGKTHLLLDGARTALDEGRPAVVLHGAQFGSDLWASVCDQLGLEPLGRDVLLGAMDSAAEASAIDGRRFVVMVDALNETPVAGFWETNLPVLRSAISQWPHLALAVSCRGAYLDVIDPGQERDRFVLETHPGFAGREIEATQKYFDHYDLEVPRIPLLTPEFSVPLFLRLYCESLRDGGKTDAAVGHEGRVKIFERYLESKVDRVARRVFLKSGGNFEIERNRRRVQKALDALLDEMAGADSEWLGLDAAEAAVASTLNGDRDQAASFIGGFEYEGVLSQELLFLRREADGVGLRVTFQAFSDFLLLKRHLERIPTPLEDQGFKDWLRDKASRGILEAANVALPELFNVELPDFLEFDASHLAWQPDGSPHNHERTSRARHVLESLIETLPYRSSPSVTQRTSVQSTC